MKKNAKIVANDGGDRMEVTVRFRNGRYSLTHDEVRRVVTSAAERIADAIRELPLGVCYGPSNTRVVL